MQCHLTYLDCDSLYDNTRKTWANGTSVFKKCEPGGDSIFRYGIFEKAVTKGVVSANFIEKYFYALWWGLQQLRYGFLKRIKFLCSKIFTPKSEIFFTLHSLQHLVFEPKLSLDFCCYIGLGNMLSSIINLLLSNDLLNICCVQN